MSPTKRPIALVTGASSGIGTALAREFAADGYDLVISGRRRAPLDELAATVKADGAEATIIVADLGADGGQGLIDALDERGLEIDVLVNNAGLGLGGALVEQDWEQIDGILAVNIRAATRLARHLVPGMIQRGRGGVLNVASLAGYLPSPYLAVYHASKAYMLSLSQAMTQELQPYCLPVTALCPGPVATEFGRRSGQDKALIFRLPGAVMTAEAVAKSGYRAFAKGKPIILPGITNKIMAASTRFSPAPLTAKLAGFLSKPRH